MTNTAHTSQTKVWTSLCFRQEFTSLRLPGTPWPTGMFILRGLPPYIRSDNRPDFVAKTVGDWINAVGAKTAYIEPGSTDMRDLKRFAFDVNRMGIHKIAFV